MGLTLRTDGAHLAHEGPQGVARTELDEAAFGPGHVQPGAAFLLQKVVETVKVPGSNGDAAVGHQRVP